MKKRVFIIHGWDGYPEEGCFPWLKKELENRGFSVFNPAMPEPLNPRIETWVPFLAKQVGVPDQNTILLGHSIGAQTVLRYLESFGGNAKVGGVVLLAGWVHLTDEAYEDKEDLNIALPWLEKAINWDKVRPCAGKFVGIFSDNDELVPLTDSEIFREKLGAQIIIEHNKGHFSGEDGVTELPSALQAILDFN
ncbi:MAG: alpha/beta hydrolase [Candidatus Paceibacterota bacterium]|jgi:hypothetical protein